jgi:hypothetical protein
MSIWACMAIWARTLDILRFIINYKVIYNFAYKPWFWESDPKHWFKCENLLNVLLLYLYFPTAILLVPKTNPTNRTEYIHSPTKKKRRIMLSASHMNTLRKWVV